jgi:glucose-1-phosphate cytidylyltransferase
MNIYAAHGYKQFLIACGYKGHIIKQYFHDFYIHHSDWIVDLRTGAQQIVNGPCVDWQVGVVDTGLTTKTGGRLKRLQPWIGTETCLVTYGDGVGDVDITALVAFHRQHGRLATVTAVHPPSRFGSLCLDGERVAQFAEKPQTEGDWINGGFFVFEPEVFRYLADDETVLEREPLERLAADGQLMAYRHAGFWQPMDTLREKELLEALWQSGRAPWKVWKDPTHETGQFLPPQARAAHRAHWVQGNVARHVA